VLFECPVDATLESNRFFALKPEDRPEKSIINAVSVRGVPPGGAVRVSLTNNTFVWFTQLLRVDWVTADRGYRFVVRNNLAVGTAGDAWVWANNQPPAAAAKQFFEGSGGNVCRPKTMLKPKSLGEAVVPRHYVDFDLDTDPKTDGFLRYKKAGDTAALTTAGMDGGPVGVPPPD
jgi:hypothetical protein